MALNNATNSVPSVSLLSSFGTIRISGADAIKFLQGQITINAETIEAGELSLAAICNPQGRCISLFFITRIDNDIYLILKQETIDETIASLKKYAVFYKVDIDDCSQQYKLFGFSQTSTESQLLIKDSHSAVMADKNIAISLIKADDSQLFEALIGPQLNIADEQQWLSALAKLSISWLTKQSQLQFLPHNLDLPKLKAVDFKKGCFTGQEVIARMQYKGKLKSHLQLFSADSVEDITPLSSILVEGKKAAEVICSARDENNQIAILALMKDSYLDNKIFHLNDENGPILKLIKIN